MIEIIDAIKSLKPNASWTLTGTSYSGLDWKDESQTKPTETEVEAEVKRLQAEYDNKEYQRKRAGTDETIEKVGTTDTIYLPIGEQLDLLYKDIVAGTVTTSGGFATAIKATKDKYPKP